MCQGLEAHRATRTKWLEPYLLAILAEALGRAGRVDEGMELVADAPTVIEITNERAWEPELYRIMGDLNLASAAQNPAQETGMTSLAPTMDPIGQAEQCYQKAIDISRSQSAKSWELRAATRLARLWQSHGKTTEARDLLAPVFGWFTEGFDTADLKNAKSLLDELS